MKIIYEMTAAQLDQAIFRYLDETVKLFPEIAERHHMKLEGDFHCLSSNLRVELIFSEEEELCIMENT